MRNSVCLLLVLLGLTHNAFAHNTVLVTTPAPALLPMPESHSLGTTNTSSPVPASAKAATPAPAKKLTWPNIKKHLKRYWQRYAIAAVLAALILEHMHTKRASQPDATKPISDELSAIERFSLHQMNLLKKAIAWLRTFSLRKNVVILARCLRKKQRTIQELGQSHQEQATVTTPNFARQTHISLCNKLGLRMQRVYKEDVFSLPHGLKISLWNLWSDKPEGTYTVGSRIDGEAAGKPVRLRFIQEDSGGGLFGNHLGTEGLYYDASGRRYQRENILDRTSYHFKLSETDAQEARLQAAEVGAQEAEKREQEVLAQLKIDCNRLEAEAVERNRQYLEQAKQRDRLRGEATRRKLQAQQLLASATPDPDPLASDEERI